ncbi:hypothetical protein ACLQ2R_17565 [Streptosporangium sp. DT93]|uniref:hypothetical protein n=1 Tax=Streptosporangium sp. DT93 TaxID=3393428 RepID=UPI003CE6CA28
MTTTMLGWIRPWYPGANGDHARADCPTLTAETDSPREGSGWLNPATATRLCDDCFAWNATCRCGASLAREESIGPHDKERAQKWAAEHFCLPVVDFTATPRPAAVDTPADGQTALFDLKDAA